MDWNLGESFIEKVNITNKTAYVKIYWKNSAEDLFFIQILMETQSWSGRFSLDNAKVFQGRLHKSNDEYLTEVKDALKQNDKMYTFHLLSEDSKTAKFSWKKTFAESTAVVLHGSVNVERDTVDLTKDNIIEYLLEQNKILLNNIEDYKQTNNVLNNKLEKNKDEFKKLVDTKNSLEDNLYGKFIQLLNTKKRRIQLLECEMENLH